MAGGIEVSKSRVVVKIPMPSGRQEDFLIDTEWDADGQVWIATSPEVGGLVIQGATWEEMMTKVSLVVPSLQGADA